MIDTKLIKTDRIVAFDCDDTLVMWHDKYREPTEGAIKVKDPYTFMDKYLHPHQRHIDLIRHFKGRGYTVIVWSQGGGEWAAEVVKALDIERFVDIIMTKPEKYVDDLPCQEWMSRIYLPSEE